MERRLGRGRPRCGSDCAFFIAASFIALLLAWISEFRGGEVLGFTQQDILAMPRF
jgi:hypothetical protein